MDDDMNPLELLGRTLKSDAVIALLEAHDAEVTYDFDRLHEGTPDAYTAALPEAGLELRFDHQQVLETVFVHNSPDGRAALRACDIPVFDTRADAQRHAEDHTVAFVQGEATLLGVARRWIRLDHGRHSTHYEFREAGLHLVTLQRHAEHTDEASHQTLGGLLALLAPFDPLLAGTFPLGLHVPGSDIDLLCEAPSVEAFEGFVHDHPEWFADATVFCAAHARPAACVVQLRLHDVDVEIFAQPVPVRAQNAFRHMIVEGRLLALGGQAFADAVRAAKMKGVKTEPAVCDLLGLPGDPYEALLALERADEATLRRLLASFLESR